MLQLQNEPKTNPNEPNFSEDKSPSKPKNRDFRQILQNLFMQNEPNGMVLVFKSQWSTMYHLTQNMQNEPNLNIILTCLTNEMKRTYSDFCKKDVKKTNPILTKS